MITVEDLLQAYAYAYDAWLDPETERKNPIPEYAEFIRRSVSWENAKLRELVRIAGTYCVNGLCGKDDGCPLYLGKPYCALPDRMRDLGIEVDE